MNNLISQIMNGFSMKDLPFLVLQLSISGLLAWLIRIHWRKNQLSSEETGFLNFLIPFQLIMTSLAIFSIKSPWMVVLFGLLALIPAVGQQSFSLRSKVYYMICLFIAIGTGSANLLVTSLVTVGLILPFLFFYKPESGNE